MQVVVRDNNVDQALKVLKKKMQREGIFRELKMKDAYEKPSIKKAREQAEAVSRARKLARKKIAARRPVADAEERLKSPSALAVGRVVRIAAAACKV